jgi:hypothetical protein
MIRNIAMAFLLAGALLAQDGGEKATVPLTDPSRPARIKVHLMDGGIVVHGGSTKDVLVETRSRSGGAFRNEKIGDPRQRGPRHN